MKKVTKQQAKMKDFRRKDWDEMIANARKKQGLAKQTASQDFSRSR
jgi:ribosome-binding protein aMBF1 (putative translation factor)